MCWCYQELGKKYSYLNIRDEVPLESYITIFADKNVKVAQAVDSDDEAPFGSDYKRIKTTALPPPSPPPPQPPAVVARTSKEPPRRVRRAVTRERSETCSEANVIGESLGISPGRKRAS